MDVICKRTTEITDDEIIVIYRLFNEVFEQKRDPATFREEYSNTVLGYSYHSMLYHEGELVGFHSCLPFYYMDNDRRFLAGLGIDSMVKKEHRDFFGFRDMIVACQNRMHEEGCVIRIGFPNDNSYPILIKGFKYKDIGKMTTYFLPLRVGGVKPSLRFLNPLSRLGAWCVIQLSNLSQNGKEYSFRYAKERESFDKIRYKWFNGEYKTIEVDNVKARYKVKVQEGARTAFLLDVHPMSKKMFDKVVREIYKREARHIDLMMYVGHLPFKPMSLITMPHKYEPKHFNFTCKVLEKGYFDDSLYDINNWDVNLSNYDLL
jgi:hypothetical protein